MDPRRERLAALLAKHALKRAQGEAFLLASGRKSSFLFDVKPVALLPEGARLIADLFLEKLKTIPADAVAGIELGGVPLVAAVVARSEEAGHPFPGLLIRKQAKDRGTKNRIEGDTRAPARVAVLEDVSTTGGSVLSAIEALREAGFTVTHVLTVVDRLEGAEGNLKQHGIELLPLFSKREFGVGE